MENTKQNKLLPLIAILLVINLLGTLWLVKQVAFQPTKLASKTADQESLPDYLSKEVIKEIYNKFEEAFNSRDYDLSWNLLSDLAKSQLNKDEMKESNDTLWPLFGYVSNGVFTYYEFVGRQGNLRTFNLYYNIKLDNSKIGDIGILQMMITDDGEEYGIVGYQLRDR